MARSITSGSTRIGRRFPYLSTLLVLCSGLLVTLVAFQSVRNSELRSLETEFERLSSERAATIEHNLRTFADIVIAVRLLYYSAGGTTRDEFSLLADPLMRNHPGIQALEWVPRVQDHERRAYEEAARNSGLDHFTITEQGVESLVPRTRQNEYFPVYFLEPVEGNEEALGFDLASNPVRRAAIEEAWMSGEGVATSRVRLVQELENSYGFLYLIPVYANYRRDMTAEERRERLEGFMVGVYNTRHVFSVSLSDFAPEGLDIQFCDLSAPDGDQLLGVWNSVDRTYHSSGMIDPSNSIFFTRKTFDLAGRTWEVATLATPAFFEGRRSILPRVVLLGGLALVLITSFSMYRNAERTIHLRDSEARYRAIVQSSPDAIVVLDFEKGRFVDGNERAANLFCCTLEQLKEMGPVDLSPRYQPDGSLSVDAARNKIEQAMSGPTRRFEWLHRDLAGREFPVEVRLGRFPSTRKNLLLGSITDISDRRKAQEEREVLERRLVEAQKLESLGLLTSGIAHDFNNLLTPIIGRADLALSELPDHGESKEHVRDILVSAQRAEELITKLLAFTGQATIELTRVAINEVCHEMGRLWEVSLPEDAFLEYDLEETSPLVEGDAGQIRQATLNLITNASDALATGGTIRIASGTQDYDVDTLRELMGGAELAAGTYAWIEVSDTGSGMNAETRSRIFDPFFTTKKPGRGLGLATVLGIAKTHRGAVSVESSAGAGTVVRLLLPVAPQRTRDPRPAEPGQAAPIVEGAVLVVDDETRIRTLIAAILGREGMSTVLAADGQEAVEIFSSQGERIRLVLVDYTMPGLSGVDVFTRIRDMDQGIPIILMSGYGERAMVSRIEDQGLTAFLQKPFDPERLLEAVHRALEPV